MRKTDYYNAWCGRVNSTLFSLLLVLVPLPGTVWSAQQPNIGENLSGYYSRDGNNGSPSKIAGNNIYLKFYPDRWLGMLFLPYPYASSVETETIAQVFATARKQTSGSSYLKGKFGHLQEKATMHIERYGYLEDRIAFECGSLAPCTIKLGDAYLELIKPGIINEHIIRYNHVAVE